VQGRAPRPSKPSKARQPPVATAPWKSRYVAFAYFTAAFTSTPAHFSSSVSVDA
jgi:hypothetical protein